MNQTRKLRNQVAVYSAALAILAELISLIFTKGFDVGFAYGIGLGTAVGIINFNLLAFTLHKSLDRNKAGATIFFTLGFAVRMLIYGGAFLLSYQISLMSAIACLIGFITGKISIYYINFVKKSIFTDRGE